MSRFKFLILCSIYGSLFFACNNVSEKSTKETKDKEKVAETKGQPERTELSNDDEESTEPVEKKVENMANEYCDCINNTMPDVDPEVKRVFSQLGKSNSPKGYFEFELSKYSKEELAKFMSELEKLGQNKATSTCTERIRKKYALKKDDVEIRKQIFETLRNRKDCELTAGMLRMAIVSREEKKEKSENQEE